MKILKIFLKGLVVTLVTCLGIILMATAIYSGINDALPALAVLIFIAGLCMTMPMAAIICGYIGGVDIIDFWFNNKK